MNMTLRTTIIVFAALAGTALLDAPPVLADSPAPGAVAPAWTPEGTAYFVSPDDPILAPDPAPITPHWATPDPAMVQDVLQTADDCLTALSQKSSPTDTEYYADGIWHNPNETLSGDWLYGAGPAGLAAVLWKYHEDHPETMTAADKAMQPWLKQVAIQTFDTALTDHQMPNGDFSDCGGHRAFFTVDFITTYLIFQDSMDPAMKARWLADMKSEIAFFVSNNSLPNPSMTSWKTDGWYVNGNVELAQAEWLYLAWKATGDTQYKTLYEMEWHKALSPDQARWKNYGLFFFKQPTKADGSDGSAYVTEASGAPGFDKEYGELQLSIVARLFVKSHDPRALRLTNLLFNSLAPHLDQKTMILNALYGSRHSTLPPFYTCAPEVLAWMGGRADLQPMLPDYFDKGVKAPFLANAQTNQGAPGIYRGYGYDLAAIVEALDQAQSH